MTTEPPGPPWPWPRAAATGVGSLPGEDPLAALRMVVDTVPDLPFLPELPARGPAADMIGRTAALLVDMPLDLQPSGWRLVPRPGLDLRRAGELWARDLDAAAAALDGWTGPVKVAVAGPWTLAAAVQRTRGGQALADAGAVRDIAGSLAEGVAVLSARLGEAMPAASVLLQLDEPSLPAVLGGRIPSPSGFAAGPVPEDDVGRARLATVLASCGPHPGVHCCAGPLPWTMLRAAGAGWVGADLSRVGPDDDDELGAALEAGLGLMAGVVATEEHELGRPEASLSVLRALLGRLGIPVAALLGRLALSPACGLAAASPGYASACLDQVRQAARILGEEQQ